MGGAPAVSRVEAIVDPYNRTHDRYQVYYRTALASYCASRGIGFAETGSRFPKQLRFLYRLRESSAFQKVLPGAAGRRTVDTMARMLGAKCGPEHALGSYAIHVKDAEIKLAIDAFDSGDVQGAELLQWCDVYFKTNLWPARAYSGKVQSLPNISPHVLDEIPKLPHLRTVPKEWDVFGLFRVWGGTDELEGVEHNLAIFEALAALKCKKKLLAYLVTGDTRKQAERLEKVGVECTTKWTPVEEVWEMSARARINIVRHGMHQCMPWRMSEMVAMGACPALDYSPTTRWPEPLKEKVHYLNLDIPYVPGSRSPFDRQALVDRVQAWLAEKDLLEEIGRETSTYFDRHMMPEKLGEHIIRQAAAPVGR